MSQCNYCGTEIVWIRQFGKPLSLNPDRIQKHFPCAGFIAEMERKKQIHRATSPKFQNIVNQFYIDREKWRQGNNFYNQESSPPWEEK